MKLIEMGQENNTPTLDDLCKMLEKSGEMGLSEQIKQSAMASRLLNPLSEGPIPKEIEGLFVICRKPQISQVILFDSVEDVFKKMKGGK